MKNTKLTNHDKPFIPTMAEWAIFFSAWHKRLEKSLGKSGSEAACEEAVQETFVKVLGLSDHLHLSAPLTPKMEGEWYAFLYYQAKGRLSCYNQQAKRFAPLPEWGLSEETFNEDDWGDSDEGYEPVAESGNWSDDRSRFREEFRKVLADVCRSAGVKDCNHRAFVRFVLDDQEGQKVVKEIKEVLNTNNLYQVTKRITNLLAKNKECFENLRRELLAA